MLKKTRCFPFQKTFLHTLKKKAWSAKIRPCNPHGENDENNKGIKHGKNGEIHQGDKACEQSFHVKTLTLISLTCCKKCM